MRSPQPSVMSISGMFILAARSSEMSFSSTMLPDPELYSLPQRIESDEAARDYIESIDFGPLIRNMVERGVNGETWSIEKIHYVERQYRNWLFLKRKHQHVRISPSDQIDEFWHAHMLDTRAYHRDTALIFGTYLHHFPYYGSRGTEDQASLQATWDLIQDLYEAEFGDAIYDFEDDDDDE